MYNFRATDEHKKVYNQQIARTQSGEYSYTCFFHSQYVKFISINTCFINSYVFFLW